jgi:membrane protease YdiL (CAAX protease family)
MRTRAPGVGRELTTFLALTFALSAILYTLIISAGTLGAGGGWYVFALMCCPGVSALVTRLIFQRNLRGEGWGWGPTRYEAIAYALPLGYAIVAYGAVWLAGLGAVDLSRFRTGVLLFITVGAAQSLFSALGEELGWRGFLVPTLARRLSFTRTALVSGAIWAAWHVPLIAGADYNSGTPTWYGVSCFAVAVISLAVPLAWLRMRSGSVWPAAILHATHNLFVQGFFDRVTVDTGPTRWLTGEFGAVLALTLAVTAWLFWRVRDRLPAMPTERDVAPGAARTEGSPFVPA